ncbi:MAG: replicative DNA helicase [bacterium]|nr:replicative DNA helicase [bacterium]
MNPTLEAQAAELEAALLYSVLVDRQQIHIAREVLSAEDFCKAKGGSLSANGRLFAHLCDMVDAGADHCDITQVVTHLRAVDQLSAVGGAAGLAEITNSRATPVNASSYAREIKTLANRRRLSRILSEASDAIANPGETLDSVLDRLMGDASAIRAASSKKSVVSIFEAGLQVLTHLDEECSTGGVHSGIPAMDECFGVFGNGTLNTIAARTSIGKSGLCLQAAEHIATDGKQVLYLSMEMPAIELAFRCLGNQARVCSQRIANRDTITSDERVHLLDALERYRDAGLLIDDSPHQTVGTITSAARAIKSTSGLDALFIDHIGLISYPSNQRRHEAIAEASRSLKRLAKELSIPVFMACQINRKGDEQGKECRPRLSHLADSTSIEMDSDNVIILHRDRPSDPVTTFAFEKVRNGQKGVRNMRMDLPSTWFVDADAAAWDDMQPYEAFEGHHQ